MFAPLILALVPIAMPPLKGPPTPPPTEPPFGSCNSAPVTSELLDPPEIDSVNGVLSVTLSLRGNPNPLVNEALCWYWVNPNSLGTPPSWIPPTLHLKQGERLQMTLINDMQRPPTSKVDGVEISSQRPDGMDSMNMRSMGLHGQEDYSLMCGQPQLSATPTPDPVTGRVYGYHRSPWNDTNMHFHGLNVSPKEPSDDVVDVMLCPRRTASEPPKQFTYVLDIPANEPPGTYWYHPHAHGESEHQVLSQLTGVIIIDPINPGYPQTLTNRTVIVRDDGEAGEVFSAQHRAIRAALPSFTQVRSDFRNNFPNGTSYTPPPFRFGAPLQCPTDAIKLGIPDNGLNQKLLRVNQIVLPSKANDLRILPHTTIGLGETQYWRFANTSADTILDVVMLVNGKQVPIPVASRDGVPLVVKNGQPTWQPVNMDHVLLSPASRMEFYMTGSATGSIVLRTLHIHSGCWGDLAYERDLLVVHVQQGSGQVRRRLPPPAPVPPRRMRFSDLAQQTPTKHRTFVFTEYNRDDEPEPDMYITELSNPTAVEHPFASHGPPDVVVKSGSVEDWTILNYAPEVHEFHIHQIHFLVMKARGIDFGSGQMLDTVEVPNGHWAPNAGGQPYFVPGAVDLRMDFRDPNIIGEFVYHCHILSHEDNGMMARIRVVP